MRTLRQRVDSRRLSPTFWPPVGHDVVDDGITGNQQTAIGIIEFIRFQQAGQGSLFRHVAALHRLRRQIVPHVRGDEILLSMGKPTAEGQVCDDLRSLDAVGPVLPTSVMVRYTVPVNPTLSLMIPPNPMGSGFGSAMSTNSILLHHTFLKKSSTTWVVSCSPGQRRYPKPKGAKPA